jgi:hypothetical protein
VTQVEHQTGRAPDSPPGGASDAAWTRGGRSGLLVVAILIGAGLATGALAYQHLATSERVLTRELDAMRAQGAGLDVEGCVDAVVRWHATCAAMKSLCDQSVPRFMDACLSAGDRSAYCEALGPLSADTRFGVAECKARGGDRAETKACTLAHRVIDGHCQTLRGEGPGGDTPHGPGAGEGAVAP